MNKYFNHKIEKIGTNRNFLNKNSLIPIKHNDEHMEKYEKMNNLVKTLKFMSLKKDIKIIQLHQKVKLLNFLSELKHKHPVNFLNRNRFKPYFPSLYHSPARNILKSQSLKNLKMRSPQLSNMFPGNIHTPYSILRKQNNFYPSPPSKRLDIIKSKISGNHHFF